MSSTSRANSSRNPYDYYTTPASTVAEFFTKFCELEPGFDFTTASVLDPCAGGEAGDDGTVMPYPVALAELGCSNVTTVDVRRDSRAAIIANYLEWFPDVQYDLVITNPPFTLALDFIVTALDDCKPGGFVVMLLRLNYFGSVGRRDFWKHHTPRYAIVHASRPRFNGKSDSTEYAHVVWCKDNYPDHTKMYVV